MGMVLSKKKYVLKNPIATNEITFQRHKASETVMWVYGPPGSATELVDIDKARRRWNTLVDAGWTL